MELTCKFKSVGNTCCFEDGPYGGPEKLQFKDNIENYDDYLNNMRFIKQKQGEYSE